MDKLYCFKCNKWTDTHKDMHCTMCGSAVLSVERVFSKAPLLVMRHCLDSIHDLLDKVESLSESVGILSNKVDNIEDTVAEINEVIDYVE